MNNWCYILFIGIALLIGAIVLTIFAEKDREESGFYCFEESIYGVFAIVCYAIGGLITFIVGTCSIVLSIGNKTNYYAYNEKYEYVMQVINNRNSLENLGITETILEYNSWLERAKSHKEVYGNWSFYRNIPVEEMQYLGVEDNSITTLQSKYLQEVEVSYNYTTKHYEVRYEVDDYIYLDVYDKDLDLVRERSVYKWDVEVR